MIQGELRAGVFIKRIVLRAFLLQLIIILLIFNVVMLNKNITSTNQEKCEELIIDINHLNRKIVKNHQISAKWVFVLNNKLEDQWSANQCVDFYDWPTKF